MPPPIVHLHLDLTNHCNFRCEFCFHHKELEAHRGFMDTGLALRVIDEVADKRLASAVSAAVFGEALLHPDFFAIADHAIGRGLGFTLNTKGGLLSPEVSKRICASGIDKLIISLNTPDEASWKRLNHPPERLDYSGHMERIRQVIDLKAFTRSRLRIFLYLMNTHFARPRGLEILSDETAARRALASWHDVCTKVAHRHGVRSPPPMDELCRRDLLTRKWPIDRGLELLDGVEVVFKEGHVWGNRMLGPGLEAVPTDRGFCPLPWNMLTIHWDGRCSPCCLDYNQESIVGDLNNSTLEEVFRGARLEQIRRRFAAGWADEPICKVCLGGVRDRQTGELVQRPQSSRLRRLANRLGKYGLGRSLEYAWQLARDRLLR